MLIGVDATPLTMQRTGIGQYLLSLLEALAEIESQNIYYLYGHQNFDLTLPPKRFIKRIKNSRSKFIWMQAYLPALICQDGVEVFWGGSYAVPLFAKKIPKVVTIHDFVYRRYPETLPDKLTMHLRMLLPFYARSARKIMVDSFCTADDLIREFPKVKTKTQVIPLAAHSRFFTELLSSEVMAVLTHYELQKDYILYVGTIEPRKGVDTLLLALQIMLKLQPLKQYRLVIVGKIGWKAAYIINMIDNLGLANYVKLLNYVVDMDLPALYQGARVFAYPSLYEGFGLPILEAMASRVPVITTNVSSIPEVGGDACTYVSPRDPEALAHALALLIDMEESERDEIRANGLVRARSFSWQRTAELILRVFQEVQTNSK